MSEADHDADAAGIARLSLTGDTVVLDGLAHVWRERGVGGVTIRLDLQSGAAVGKSAGRFPQISS